MLTLCMLRGSFAVALAMLWLFVPGSGTAQEILKELEQGEHQHDDDHAGHNHGHDAMPGTEKTSTQPKGHGGHKHTTAAPGAHSGHKHATRHNPQGHGDHQHTTSHNQPHPGGEMHQHEMRGFLGPYPIQREGSGTSWLPDTTPHFGVHATYGDWQTMYHALFNLVYDHQGGPRGADKTFVNGMFMGMAERPLGEGTWGLRAMLAPDPFMGANGYPLLFATARRQMGAPI